MPVCTVAEIQTRSEFLYLLYSGITITWGWMLCIYWDRDQSVPYSIVTIVTLQNRHDRRREILYPDTVKFRTVQALLLSSKWKSEIWKEFWCQASLRLSLADEILLSAAADWRPVCIDWEGKLTKEVRGIGFRWVRFRWVAVGSIFRGVGFRIKGSG